MGLLYQSKRIRSYILIFLVFVAILISAPIKKWITSTVDSYLDQLKSTIYETTGVSIAYKSMSPSILSNLVIKDIQILDVKKENVISINKAKIVIGLKPLLSRDIYNIVSGVTVDGIVLDVDKIIELTSRVKTSVQKNNLDLDRIQKMIPANIKFRNISISYDDYGVDSVANIKAININNDAKSGFVNVQMDATCEVIVQKFNRHLSGEIVVTGRLSHELEHSQVNVKLLDLTDGNYHLNKLSFYAGYENNKIAVHTIQSVNPVSIAVDYDVKNQFFNAQFKAAKFSPLSVFTINSKQKELKKLKNVSIDSDTILNSSIKDKKLNFVSDTEIYIPDELFTGGMTVEFSLFGNEEECELTKFKANGKNIDSRAELTFAYKNQQLSGFAELNDFVLKNNKSISTEIYFDPLYKGFMAFSPQLFIGDKAYTALQLSLLPQNDSYDFTMEAYDYSKADFTEPGQLQVTGSYLTKSNYLQTNIGLSSIYFDSLAELAAQLVEPDKAILIEKYMDKLNPYVFSGDIYASSDFKSVSYNVPYILMANTKVDNQFLMMSMNGSEQNIQLDQLSLIFGQYNLEASATLDRNPDTNDYFYTVDMNAASIPYHFSGSVMQNLVTLTGDYGTSIEINFEKNNLIDGAVLFDNLPFGALGKTFIFSLESKFHYDELDGPDVTINRLETEIADGSVAVAPKISLAGNMTKYGAQIVSMAYTDMYSTLEGTSDLMININDGVLDSIGVMLSMKNPLSDEGITIDGSISNPEHMPLNIDNLMKYIYLNLQVQLNSFGLNRFGFQANDNNRMTATLYSSGTVEHPYISLNVDNSAILISTEFLNLSGNFILEDRDFSIEDLYVSYNVMNITDIQASGSLNTMSMEATGYLDCEMMGKTLFAPLKLGISNAIIPEGKIMPDSFLVDFSSDGFSGTLLKKPFPLSFSMFYSDNIYTITSSENFGLSGMYTSDGIMELTLDNSKFIKAKLDGYVNFNQMALQLYDFYIDLAKVFEYINMDELIEVKSGIFTSEMILGGNMDTPDFDGFGEIKKLDMKLPSITGQRITSDGISFTALHDEITINKFLLNAKSGETLELGFNVFLNKWSVNHVEGSLKTLKKGLFPLKISTPAVRLKGDVSLDVLLHMENNILDVEGKVFGENLQITSSVSSLSSISANGNQTEMPLKIRTDIDVTLGTHASVNFDPILRCVFVPNTALTVKLDQIDDLFSVTGKLSLKSGDLSYLNRNFYIKSGSIKFNPSDISNPIITVNAETREKDEKGQTVRIILDVDNQYLLSLDPKFSAVPAKSENEIQALLGQIVVADSASAANFFVAASDYAIQSIVVRTAENKLRDLLNFDIFSLRTNVLQNTFNMTTAKNSSNKSMSVGNLLDNSTVYIGKYLGSSLYLDAMLHMTFEDRFGNNINSTGSLVFQPEFGMELESPFANIRVNMAPDINALLNNQFVPATSVTLSWKFAF